MTVAKIVKGKVSHPNVSFVIAPGSKQVLENIARDGGLTDLIAAGARIAESACGFCIGNSQSPKTEAVSLRTSNRNFLGRSGTKSANRVSTGTHLPRASGRPKNGQGEIRGGSTLRSQPQKPLSPAGSGETRRAQEPPGRVRPRRDSAEIRHRAQTPQNRKNSSILSINQ